MELLDQAYIDVCSNVVSLKSVLDTCTRHQKTRRLEKIINRFSKPNLRAGEIKAYVMLKHLQQCWASWKSMQERCVLPRRPFCVERRGFA